MRNVFTVFAVLTILFTSLAQNQRSVTPYGLVQYRLRSRIQSAFSDDASVTVHDYANTISYYGGLTVVLNNQLSFGLQIGNDWVFTEDVNFLNNNPAPQAQFPLATFPYFHLAYARYNPGFLEMMLGIVPVLSHGPLDLLERSLSTGTYRAAPFFTWPVVMNNSFMGLKIGRQVVGSEGFSLGVDLLTSVIDSRVTAITTNDQIIEQPARNPTSLLFVLDIPVTAGTFLVTPQLAAITNRNYNSALEGGDHEVTGGFSLKYSINERWNITGVIACASVNNFSSRNPVNQRTADTLPVSRYDHRGFITGVVSNMTIGPGVLTTDVKYGFSDNREADNGRFDYLYADLRYDWNVHPNFSIMPRIRNFTTFNPSGTEVKMTMENRPELIFTGSF